MTETIGGPLLYLDTNPFIYLVEGNDRIATPINELMKLLEHKPGLAATSELTLAEVLPNAPDASCRRRYMSLIVWSKVFLLLPVSRGVLMETARYRRGAATKRHDGGKSIPKLPDAIHIVTAVQSGCRMILSNDGRLRIPRPLVRFSPDPKGIAELTQKLA